MAIARAHFLSLLMSVKPALAGKGGIRGLDNIWLNKLVCSAYNGVIQLKVPTVEKDYEQIEGGVPGDVLISFLKSVSAETIDLDMGSTLTVRAGDSNLKLPVLETKENACEFPDLNEQVWDGLIIPEGFVTALERALVAVNKNSSLDAYTGVLIEPGNGDTINMFSTDNKSLCWESVDHPDFGNWWEGRVMLPGEFCTQLLRIVDNETHFHADEGYAAIVNSDPTYLTTRLLDTASAPRFAAAVERHITSVDTYYPIPADLRSAIERCELIKPDRGEEPLRINIKKNRMGLSLEAAGMHAKDEISTEHADANCTIDSGLLLRAIDNYNEFAIAEECLVLHGEGDSYYMISRLQD